MRILLAILILCGACFTRAAVNSNYTWAFYGIDSFSFGDSWQFSMRSNSFVPNRALNYSTNGYSFGRWVTNVWPLIKAQLPPVNSATQAVIFLMGGVNPNATASYADNAEYTAAQFIAKHAEIVTEARSSNAIVVAYTITGHISDANTSDFPGSTSYATWKSTINAALMTGGANYKIDVATTWPYSEANYPDGIHPKAEIYEWIGTNTEAVLRLTSTNAAAPRVARANRGSAGRIKPQ